MNARTLPLLLLGVLAAVSGLCQSQGIHLKLQLMPEGNRWGVYAKPVGISPSANTITASGQVTVVMPIGFPWGNFQNAGGQWINNASSIGPVENPGRQYVSFGLLQAEPLYPVSFAAGEETLLFSFASDVCPDSLWLIDCHTPTASDPFCPNPSNSYGSNPGNDLTVLDFENGFEFYAFQNIYAPAAWNCHDCDGDGIPNAFEDSNGDGQWTPGVDVSNLCAVPGCLEMKIRYLKSQQKWGVFVRPQAGFAPSANAQTVDGQVTIVTPSDFAFANFSSVAGEWSQLQSVVSPAANPGMAYTTFELLDGGNAINYAAAPETLLFTFDRTGDCPESLALWQLGDAYPALPNLLSGHDPDQAVGVDFSFCGVYAQHHWRCPSNGGAVLNFVPGQVHLDSLVKGGNGSMAFAAGEKTGWMQLAPNPASDFLQARFSTQNIESQVVVHLLNLHGQPVQQYLTAGRSQLQIDLTALPAGLYILALEVDGRVLARQRFLKQ